MRGRDRKRGREGQGRREGRLTTRTVEDKSLLQQHISGLKRERGGVRGKGRGSQYTR